MLVRAGEIRRSAGSCAPDTGCLITVSSAQIKRGFLRGARICAALITGPWNWKPELRARGVSRFSLHDYPRVVFNWRDQASLCHNRRSTVVCVTVAGSNVALVADVIIVRPKWHRFARSPKWPRTVVPGFGGIPRLKRDIGNCLRRVLLLTGHAASHRHPRDQAVGLVRS
jgi:hypothetical protein